MELVEFGSDLVVGERVGENQRSLQVTSLGY